MKYICLSTKHNTIHNALHEGVASPKFAYGIGTPNANDIVGTISICNITSSTSLRLTLLLYKNRADLSSLID